MVVAIAERLEDLAGDLDAAHGALVVTLDPADHGRGATYGYAALRIATPAARHEGVAVVVGDEAVGSVPDPVRILVRDGKGRGPSATLSIRRKALPVLVRVDVVAGSAVVLRRIGAPEEPEAAGPTE